MHQLEQTLGRRLQEILDGEAEVAMQPDDEEEVVILGPNPVLQEGTPLSLEFATQMMDQFVQGRTLGRDSLLEILRRAALVLGRRPNVCEVPIFENCRVNVVGDIHGQLADLITIFKLSGLPNERNAYVFNGDVVDRGSQSVECLVTILTLMCLYPNSVFLNRGNHESRFMNHKDGFETEVNSKYDPSVYQCFAELFCLLPLATVIQHKIFVVHGGLAWPTPHLLQLQAEDRLHDDPPDDSLMKDLLWSDPCDEDGLWANEDRGAGVLFGPDVTEEFLDLNDLDFVVRSHECVDEGYLLSPPDAPKLATLFSASNYCGIVDNFGAFAIFTLDLVPRFVQYQAEPLHQIAACFSYRQTMLEDDVAWKLPHLINRRYLALIEFWSNLDRLRRTRNGRSQQHPGDSEISSGSDSEGDVRMRGNGLASRGKPGPKGVISRQTWARGLRAVLGLKIDFLRFQKLLGLPVLGVTGNVDGPINFYAWLSQYRTIPSRSAPVSVSSCPPELASSDQADPGEDQPPRSELLENQTTQPMEVEQFDFEVSDSDTDDEDLPGPPPGDPRRPASAPQAQQQAGGGGVRPTSGVRAAGANLRIRRARQWANRRQQSGSEPPPPDYSEGELGEDSRLLGAPEDGHAAAFEDDLEDAGEEDDDDDEEMFEREQASLDKLSAAEYDDDLTVWEWDEDDSLPPPPPPFDIDVDLRVRPAIEEARRSIEELREQAEQRWEEFQAEDEDLEASEEPLLGFERPMELDADADAQSVNPAAAEANLRRRVRRRLLDPEVYRAGKLLLKQISAVLFVNRFEVETLFRFFDTSGSGAISRRELQDGIRSLMSQKNLPRHISELDIRSAFAVLLQQHDDAAAADSSADSQQQPVEDDRRTISFETFCRVFSKADPWFGAAESELPAEGAPQIPAPAPPGVSQQQTKESPALPFRRVNTGPLRGGPPGPQLQDLLQAAAVDVDLPSSLPPSLPSPPESPRQSSATASGHRAPPAYIRGSIHHGPRASAALERAYRPNMDRPQRRRASVPAGLSMAPAVAVADHVVASAAAADSAELSDAAAGAPQFLADAEDDQRSLLGRRRLRMDETSEPAEQPDSAPQSPAQQPPVASHPSPLPPQGQGQGQLPSAGELSWGWLPRHLAWQKAARESDQHQRQAKRRRQHFAPESQSLSDHEVDYGL